MTARETSVSRRAFLLVAAGAAASCTSRAPRPAADPDAGALAQARAAELQLLAAYAPGSPGYDVHAAHLRALGGTLPSPPPTAAPASAAANAAAERASVPVLQAAAVAARTGTTAATLASVAASHAVLGGMHPPR